MLWHITRISTIRPIWQHLEIFIFYLKSFKMCPSFSSWVTRSHMHTCSCSVCKTLNVITNTISITQVYCITDFFFPPCDKGILYSLLFVSDWGVSFQNDISTIKKKTPSLTKGLTTWKLKSLWKYLNVFAYKPGTFQRMQSSVFLEYSLITECKLIIVSPKMNIECFGIKNKCPQLFLFYLVLCIVLWARVKMEGTWAAAVEFL